MNQELIINPVSNKINLNDLLWNKGSDFIIYRYEKPIDRIEKLNENKEVIEINDYSLQLEASLYSKYDTNLKNYFQLEYSCNWIKRYYYNIDSKNNKHDFNNSLSLFNSFWINVYFDKENKSKLKSKIKSKLDKIINEDLKTYFVSKYLTIEKPIEQNWFKRSQNLENEFRNLGDHFKRSYYEEIRSL